MAIMPDDLVIDETVDTSRMAPEDDFAPVGDPAVPRKGVSDASAESRDLEAGQFEDGGIPNAFAPPADERYGAAPVRDTELSDPADQDFVPSGDQGVVGNADPGSAEAGPETWDQDLLDAAGLNVEDAASQFGTPAVLQNAVRMTDVKFVEDGRHRMGQPTVVEETIEAAPAEQPWELPPLEGDNEWNDETKQIVSAIGAQTKALLDAQNAKIAAQEQALIELKQQQAIEATAQATAEFDEMVNALPQEYKPLLGEGTVDTIPSNSIAFYNRMQLQQTMTALNAGLHGAGRKPIAMDELMVRALGVMYPNEQRAVIRQEVVGQVAERQSLMTAPPTKRGGQPMTPTQQAGRNAEEWYKKHGVASDMDDEF